MDDDELTNRPVYTFLIVTEVLFGLGFDRNAVDAFDDPVENNDNAPEIRRHVYHLLAWRTFSESKIVVGLSADENVRRDF